MVSATRLSGGLVEMSCSTRPSILSALPGLSEIFAIPASLCPKWNLTPRTSKVWLNLGSASSTSFTSQPSNAMMSVTCTPSPHKASGSS